MELTYLNAALVPVIVGVVEAIKGAGMPSRWAALTSIVLGVLGVGLLSGFAAVSVIVGIGTGLAAAGLYSGSKATVTPTP